MTFYKVVITRERQPDTLTGMSQAISDLEGPALVRAIVTMAHALRLQVTAEGVETAAQRAFLEEIGCDALQGYVLGRPVPAGEMTRQLQESFVQFYRRVGLTIADRQAPPSYDTAAAVEVQRRVFDELEEGERTRATSGRRPAAPARRAGDR